MKKIIFILLFLLLSTTSYANEIKTISSSEFLSLITKEKDKIIIVNFFASWCPPCIEETPDFIQIRNEYTEAQVYIIGLSIDDDNKALEKFLNKANINFPVYVASNELAAAYRVSSIPHTAMYSKNLKQIYGRAGILDYTKLKKIIDSEL